MYTATMLYHFRDESFDEACEIWNDQILKHASTQPGFVRMQLLTAKPKALAIGTWEDSLHARTFMETGVFKLLMRKLHGLIAEQPQQTIWDLRFYASR